MVYIILYIIIHILLLSYIYYYYILYYYILYIIYYTLLLLLFYFPSSPSSFQYLLFSSQSIFLSSRFGWEIHTLTFISHNPSHSRPSCSILTSFILYLSGVTYTYLYYSVYTILSSSILLQFLSSSNPSNIHSILVGTWIHIFMFHHPPTI